MQTSPSAAERDPGETLRDLWSPTWANGYLGQAPWVHEHLGRWVAYEAHLLFAVFEEFDEANRYMRGLSEQDRPFRQLQHLTLDDDEDKHYLYVPPATKLVYYARSATSNIIKIGTSKKVLWRLLELSHLAGPQNQPWELLAVERGSYSLEAERHDEFADYWISPKRRGDSREWFEPGRRLVEHINRVLRKPPKWCERADVTSDFARLELDRVVPQPEYRPRLDARVTESTLASLTRVAASRGVSLDDLVEQVLTEHVPFMPEPEPEPEPVQPRRLTGEERLALRRKLLTQTVEAGKAPHEVLHQIGDGLPCPHADCHGDADAERGGGAARFGGGGGGPVDVRVRGGAGCAGDAGLARGGHGGGPGVG